MTGQTYRMD